MGAFYKCVTSTQQIAHFMLQEAEGVRKELSFDKRGLLIHEPKIISLSGKDAGEEIKDGLIKANTMVKFLIGVAFPKRELLLVANPILSNFGILNGVSLYGTPREPTEIFFTMNALKQFNVNELQTNIATLFLME
jgi:hypothetical protein